MNLYRFKSKSECLTWFELNPIHEPIWIVFDKRDTPFKLTQEEALDVALCYGWIDGLIKRIDEYEFMKYFSMRRKKSVWSSKNKHSVDRLISEGLMTEYGFSVIEQSKVDGSYEQGDDEPLDFSLEEFEKLVQVSKKAFDNYKKMSYSIKKTYALHYYTAKKDETRTRRLIDILSRLEDNLKPLDRRIE